MSKVQLISDRLNLAVTIFCAVLLVIMLAISFSGAIYQAVTGDALSWTYSLARQFVPWIALLSITVAFKNGEHVAMAMVVNALPIFLRVALKWVVVFAIGALSLVLFLVGLQFTAESNQLVMISDQIQFSQRWVAASVPTAGAVLMVHLANGPALLESSASFSGEADDMSFDEDHLNSERNS